MGLKLNVLGKIKNNIPGPAEYDVNNGSNINYKNNSSYTIGKGRKGLPENKL